MPSNEGRDHTWLLMEAGKAPAPVWTPMSSMERSEAQAPGRPVALLRGYPLHTVGNTRVLCPGCDFPPWYPPPLQLRGQGWVLCGTPAGHRILSMEVFLA